MICSLGNVADFGRNEMIRRLIEKSAEMMKSQE